MTCNKSHLNNLQTRATELVTQAAFKVQGEEQAFLQYLIQKRWPKQVRQNTLWTWLLISTDYKGDREGWIILASDIYFIVLQRNSSPETQKQLTMCKPNESQIIRWANISCLC